MICPGCGKESGVESPFCTYCGANLSFTRHKLDEEKSRLKDAIEKGERPDRIISPWFVAIPLVVNVTVAVVMVVAIFSEIFSYDVANGEMPATEVLYQDLEWLFAFAVIGNALFYGLFAVLTYFLLDRANKHIEAEKGVREAIVTLLHKIHGANPVAEAQPPWKTYGAVPESAVAFQRRNPLPWVLVLLIPLVGGVIQLSAILGGDYDPNGGTLLLTIPLMLLHVFLVFYLLDIMTQDTATHDRDWTDFATETRISFAKAGAAAGDLEVGHYVPPRPSALYILMTAITGGLFMFYWWYVIIKDGNTHYNKQAWFEEALMRMLSSVGR